MKKALTVLLLVLSSFYIGIAQNSSLINIAEFGAISGSNEYAEHNTQVIKLAIKSINKGKYSSLFIPKGVWYINELLQSDGIDFRYVNWQGSGKRHSIIKLANGRNKPIIETKMYFESHIRDIQFNGNAENNPDSEYLMSFSSGNCYTIDIDNVYYRDYSGIGLYLNGVTHFTLDNVDAKYGGVGGLKALNCLSVVTTNTDFEQNKEYAMLFESSFNEGRYRYLQPLIEINNAYCESNGVGILLKGICNVSVNGIFNYGGIAAKITHNDSKTAFSHYNTFDGKHVGKIIIDKGNYGNKIEPSISSVVDLDGRNTNFLIGEVTKKYVSATDLKIAAHKNHKVNYLTDSIEIISTSNNTASSAYIISDSETNNLYLKIKGDLNSRLSIRIYDLKFKKYYNFSTLQFQDSHRDYNAELILFANGDIQHVKIPINLEKSAKPRIQIKFSSKNDDKAILKFYGYETK